MFFVGEFDIFEEESGHWKFQLVGLCHLLFDLLTEFGQILTAFHGEA